MNIDNLREDIADMEEEGDFNPDELLAMENIADAYDEDRTLCSELIEKFRLDFGYKINII